MSKKKALIMMVFLALVAITVQQSAPAQAQAGAVNYNMVGGEKITLNCEGDGIALEPISQTIVDVICKSEVAPTPTPTDEPPSGEISVCESHNPTQWHGLIDEANNCHYAHEHHANPHDLDGVFGTEFYTWAGGSISFPWQTFAGAGPNFEQPADDACFENECKHEGYKWLMLERPCVVAEGSTGCITHARIQMHGIFAQPGALTRFHSVWVEARVCQADETNCGIYRGGGHLDLGRLNFPDRGVYHPLPGDPPAFAEGRAELQPYRIHGPTDPDHRGVLASWQSQGNQFNYLADDPEGQRRLRVGYAVHVRDEWGGIDPDNPEVIPFICPDFKCKNNNSEAAVFRSWVIIPESLDGSEFDEDGTVNGLFTFHGLTNRYGDIVTGCSQIGLDCVPVQVEGVNVGRNSHRDSPAIHIDFDTSPPGEWWIKYPN